MSFIYFGIIAAIAARNSRITKITSNTMPPRINKRVFNELVPFDDLIYGHVAADSTVEWLPIRTRHRMIDDSIA